MTEGTEAMQELELVEPYEGPERADSELVDDLIAALRSLIERAKEKPNSLKWFQKRVKEALTACLENLMPLQRTGYRLCVMPAFQERYSSERRSKLRASLEEHGAKSAAITALETWLVGQANKDYVKRDELDSGVTITDLRPSALARYLSDGRGLSLEKLHRVTGLGPALVRSLMGAFVSAGYVESKEDLTWSFEFLKNHTELL